MNSSHAVLISKQDLMYTLRHIKQILLQIKVLTVLFPTIAFGIHSIYFHMYSSNTDALFGRHTKISFSSFFDSTVQFSNIREYLQEKDKSSTLPEWRLAHVCYVLWPLVRLSVCCEWAHTQEHAQEHTHTCTTYVHVCIAGHTNQLRQTQTGLTRIQAGLVTLSCSSLLLIMLEVCSGENIYVYICTVWIFLVYGLRHSVFPVTVPRSQSPKMLDLYIQDILHSSSSYSLVHTHVTHSGKLRNGT